MAVAQQTAAANLLAGPLAQAGGVTLVDGLPNPAWCEALWVEARDAYADAARQELDHGDDADGRGGTPQRALWTAGGGPIQDELYAATWLSEYLSGQCGMAIRPTGNRGSYSYYMQPGDFLGLHLDIDSCDVTLITVLHDATDPHDPAGALAVYPQRIGWPLRTVRAEAYNGMMHVKARPGQSVVLLGGMVPHFVVPMSAGCTRVISALCFRAC